MPDQAPPISPDGAYWWDGQAWRPMPVPAAAVPAPEPAAARPSWLPVEAEMPAAPQAQVATAAPAPTSVAPAAYAPPLWEAPAPQASNRRNLTLVGAVAIILVVALAGGLGVRQLLSQQPANTDTGIVAATSPEAAASPSASIAPAPLTAQLGGEYCPVAHRGDSACWKGSLVNTGPGIRKLAFIFVVGGGYASWFANHANGTLSGFYTTAGCEVDAAAGQIVCGPAGPGAEVDVYLGGDVTTRGTFTYAVKFADVSGASPVYFNQHADGTHEIVTWTEHIT